MRTDPIKTGYIFRIRSHAARWGQNTAYHRCRYCAAPLADLPAGEFMLRYEWNYGRVLGPPASIV